MEVLKGAVHGAIPITVFEPLSILQLVSEELYYAPQLLDKACASDSALDRLTFVAAFSITPIYTLQLHRFCNLSAR